MLRNNGPLIPDDPAASRARVPASEDLDDALDSRLLDLDAEEEPAFLRAQKRVPVRRGPLPKKAANRLKIALIVCAAAGVIVGISLLTYRYGAQSWRFRLDSSDQLEVSGIRRVSRAQIMEVMGGDIGRNVFFIPLADRQKQLEEIPWVEGASVMRLLPNRIKIDIRERTPVAFVQIGSKIALIDAHGVVMDLPAGAARKYSFPVIVGMGSAEPLSTRAARMTIYSQLIRDLDSSGAQYSQGISEVDLSDPDDVKITTSDPDGAVLVHLGSSDYLARFKTYVAHLQEWRQQVQKVRSVDLRYDQQVVVNPDESNPPPTKAAAKPKRAAKKK
ncbi:MAG: FtsQ-type POTRA domain-containing protein [Acidobacteriia bacterium]|nr:FtsQ-type POTRA domain-containing protein [Terriglobia bacterium]